MWWKCVSIGSFFILFLTDLTILEKTSKLASSIIASKGLELVEIKFYESRKSGLLKVFITKPGGVTIKDCSDVSRELKTLIDAEGVFEGLYSLEVSSPGLDRPLTEKRDFERNVGQLIKVIHQNTFEDTHTLIGKLIEVIKDEIILQTEEITHSIAINEIVNAKIEVQV